jgi:hypothetical protein
MFISKAFILNIIFYHICKYIIKKYSSHFKTIPNYLKKKYYLLNSFLKKDKEDKIEKDIEENINEQIDIKTDQQREDEIENKDNENNQLVLYKNKDNNTNTNKNRISLKEIYENFFNPNKKNNNNKNINIEENIDLSLFEKAMKEKKDKYVKVDKTTIIYNKNFNNLNLDSKNNFLTYQFNVKKGYSYKIKCNLLINNIKNIKLIITDNKKRFLYDFSQNNHSNKNIYEYGFVLDNNIFNIDGEIFIYLIFYDDQKNFIFEIKNFIFEVLEYDINNNNKNNNAIIVIKVNNKNYPLLPNLNNIIDYSHSFNDKSSLFFI